jgi:hypothetical protein
LDKERKAASEAVEAPSAVKGLLSNNIEDLYVLGMQNGDISEYSKEYRIFLNWLSCSLDIIKPYLQAINFALFVHW